MKKFFVLLCVLGILIILPVKSAALDVGEIEESLRSAIPEQARGIVGDISLDGGDNRFGFDFFITSVKRILREVLGGALKNISALCAFTLAAALFGVLSDSAGSEQLRSLYRFVAVLCLSAFCYGILRDIFESAEYSIGTISSFSNAMLPVMTLLYGSGGNLSAAAVNAAASALAFDAVGLICGYLIYPIFNISFCFALAGGCGADDGVSRVGAFVSRFSATVLSAVTSLFCALLIYQDDLARCADSAAMRGIKFAASRSVPIVGGAVSEAASVLGGSLSYIKGAVGSASVAVIFAVAAPVLLSLFVYSFGFSAAACAADLLGIGAVSGFLGRMKAAVGYCTALLTSCTAVFIVIFTLLIRSADLFR